MHICLCGLRRCVLKEFILVYSVGQPGITHLILKFGFEACATVICLTSDLILTEVNTKQILQKPKHVPLK